MCATENCFFFKKKIKKKPKPFLQKRKAIQPGAENA